MNLKFYFNIISLTTLCLAQDYTLFQNKNQYPTDNSNSNYNSNNPLDPNHNRFNNDFDSTYRNQNGLNNAQYDPNRSQYNLNKNQNDLNTGQYDPTRNSYDNRYDANHYIPESTQRTLYENRYSNSGVRGAPLDHDSLIINEATYFIVASRMVRPGQIYKICVNILRAKLQMTIRSSISCNGVELADVIERVKEGVPAILNIRVPTTTVPGDYKLRVEGLYLDDPFGGKAFVNETQLTFSKRFMTIFIQMDKPVYMQGQTVRFRAIPINTELKPFGRAIDVYILDPNRRIMKRWLSRQSNFGTVSLQYQLSDQPVFGEWIVRVEAMGQVEEAEFLVEEYYQTRFEVNVTMPAFFFNTDPYIYGQVMANYTSGAPVKGNLTLKAIVRPIPQYRPRKHLFKDPRLHRERPGYNAYLYNESTYQNPLGYDQEEYMERYKNYLPGQPNQLDHPDWWYDPQKVYTRVFNFDEKFPFWMTKPDIYGGHDPSRYDPNRYDPSRNDPNYLNNQYGSNNYYTNQYYDQLPYLRFFNGTYHFKFPMSEITSLSEPEGVEVIIVASVGDPLLEHVQEAYSICRIHNSSLKLTFLGGSPQVFKPTMPIDVYMVVSYHDGSPVEAWRARGLALELEVHTEGRGSVTDPPRPRLVPGHNAVWHTRLHLHQLLKLGDDPNYREILNSVTGVRVRARITDFEGGEASSELRFIAHYSPRNYHIKISTSTTDARVGEYIIFHVQSNVYIEAFNYIVMSKGIIITGGQQNMQEGVCTFSVSVSAEMAPVSSVLVWAARSHLLMADSITFPVNGISRNNFTVIVNNRKHRTGERVEVAIYGEPGAYVGLSAIDNAFYTMQGGNELTYAKVISKMSHFDEDTNGTFSYTWRSHLGIADDLVYFPSSSFGIDANRTFEFAGLIVLSDVPVTRRAGPCNVSLGLAECLEGGCYPLHKRCDRTNDCPDHSDETNCPFDESFSLAHFRKFRFSRVQRQYDNVWLWRDVNIGPHGRYVFVADVPSAPAHWHLSAFSMGEALGLGMLRQPLEYTGILPFFMKVEGPDKCRQGEQLGLRVVVFNYQMSPIEAVVVLEASPDYMFVHVEENGIVKSYNPRTSFGEHQMLVYIGAGDAATLHVPVVSTRLGTIAVRLHADTLLGTHRATHTVRVQADGVAQRRHQAVLLDLSTRAYVFQYLHVNVTETPLIPYEVARYYVFGSNHATLSVVGDVVGPLFPTMPVNATSMLLLPMESAEQNMFSFAANMYLTYYMRLINQRNRTLENEAFYHMNVLYQRQLSFMRPDGSFSLFRADWNHSSPSVWLTSFCARVFQQASFNEWENFIYIDPEIISTSVSWVLQHQLPHGAFYEVTWLSDRNQNDTFRLQPEQLGDQHYSYVVDSDGSIITQRNITLTAQVVITLQTVKNLKDIGVREGLSARVVAAQQLGVSWLEKHLSVLSEHGTAHEMAIVAYALTHSKAASAEQAYRQLLQMRREEGGLQYWGRERVPQPPTKIENQKPFLLPRLPYTYDSNNIAATSYALLACMDHQDYNEPIVMWLNTQRLSDQGWASTQDTYIAMQALIEYTNRKRIRDVSELTLTVEAVALKGQSHTVRLHKHNLAIMQTVDIPEAWGTIKVTARGAGFAILQLSTSYNVDTPRFQTAPPVPAFSLYAGAHYSGRNHSHIHYQACASWILSSESPRSGLAVLEVSIPTGYFMQQQRLDQAVRTQHNPKLMRAKYTPEKVLFYLTYLDEEVTCVNFTVERWFPVANMSRYLAVRVYDYYAPERFNETIFDALPTYLLNICEVCGSSQCPYCSIYNAATTLTYTAAILCLSAAILVANQFRAILPYT